MFAFGREQRSAEIERVKQLIQKEREFNTPIYNINGCEGRSIKVYRDRCIIKTDANLDSFLTGNATDGEKTIFYSDVVGVQYKPSSGKLSIGYIQLETSSAQMNNIRSNFFGENTFTFKSNDKMDEVRDYIIYQISLQKRTCLNLDVANKYSAYLFKYNIMTPDRRNWIKELHMYHDRNAWNLIIKVQCRSKEAIKAIQADLEIKNVFEDMFPVKGVQFLFSSSLSETQTSMAWNCQIPDEYARSISRVDIHIRKIAYEGKIVDETQNGCFANDISNVPADDDSHCKAVERMLQEVSGLRRARDIHERLLTEIQQGNISIPDVELKDLSETVAAERLYGVSPVGYLSKLKNILSAIYNIA